MALVRHVRPIGYRVTAYVLLVGVWALVAWTGHLVLAAVVHGIARLAYVGFVGGVLYAEEHRGSWSARWGSEGAYRRFRSVTTILMAHDGMTFLLLAVVGGDFVLPFPWPHWLSIAVGVPFIVVGLGIKIAATRALGDGGFYWRDFFLPPDRAQPCLSGPYRWLRNPMYGLGYLHTYGIALVLGSVPGLVAAAFDQVCILAFQRQVEGRHRDRLYAVRIGQERHASQPDAA